MPSLNVLTPTAIVGIYKKPTNGIPATDLTTAAQTSLGKADTAIQPAALTTALAGKADTSLLAPVATAGTYASLTGKPTLGTASAQDATAFATAVQGTKADSAVQPAALAAFPVSINQASVLATTTPVTVGALHQGKAGPTLQTTAVTCRVPIRVSVPCTNPHLLYSGAYITSGYIDGDWPADQPITASIEVSGTIYPVTFGGRKTGIIGSGGVLRSDPVGLDLPAGDYYIRTCLQPITHSVTTTNGSATITDPLITATDYGRTVTGTGIPASSYVGTVTPGVGFTLSTASMSQAGSATATASGTVAATLGPLWYPNRVAITGPGGYGGSTTGDLTPTGSAAITEATALTNLIGPTTILATPTTAAPTIVAVGDSICAGVGDGVDMRCAINPTYPALASGGFVTRALTGTAGLVSIAVAGDTASNFRSNNGHFRKLGLATLARNAIVEYSTNDIYAGNSLATLQGNLLAIYAMTNGRGLRTFQTTCIPRTTSTDGWLTPGNQTAANATYETVRAAFNAWLRDGAPINGSGSPVATGTAGAARCTVYGSTGAVATAASGAAHPLYGVIDTAATVETGGAWIAPPTPKVRTVTDAVTDGGGYTVNSATAAFTNADLGRMVSIAGAGASGALYVGQIKIIGSATQSGLAAVWSTNVTAASMSIYDGITVDGVHPAAAGHARMATAIPLAALRA